MKQTNSPMTPNKSDSGELDRKLEEIIDLAVYGASAGIDFNKIKRLAVNNIKTAFTAHIQAVEEEKDKTISLMVEWFNLKDQQANKKLNLLEFSNHFMCTNMATTEFNDIPMQCIYRGVLSKDYCEDCTKRHLFYESRKLNSAKRRSMLDQLRQRLAQYLGENR